MDLRTTKRKLSTKWWASIDRYVLSCVIILSIIGIALLMAASPSVAQRIGYEPFYFVKKQFAFLVIGFCIIIGLSFTDSTTTRRIAILGYLGCLLLLIFVELAGYETKGARRWVRLLGFSIQPSEVIKPFLAVLTAWILTRKTTEKNFPGYTYATLSVALVLFFVIRQPDFGMTLSIAVIWFSQLIIGGLNVLLVFSGAIFGLIGIITAYFLLDHVRKRIDVFLDASSGDNYQTSKSLQAFENGGVFGTGPGQGRVKEILPDSHTDFIFSVAGEEFGLIFCLGLIFIYAFLSIRCLYQTLNSKDLFVVLAVSGLTIQIFFQAAINMGVAINLLPNTGMTLPFVSYGGSSMISASLAIGMILSFTRKKFG